MLLQAQLPQSQQPEPLALALHACEWARSQGEGSRHTSCPPGAVVWRARRGRSQRRGARAGRAPRPSLERESARRRKREHPVRLIWQAPRVNTFHTPSNPTKSAIWRPTTNFPHITRCFRVHAPARRMLGQADLATCGRRPHTCTPRDRHGAGERSTLPPPLEERASHQGHPCLEADHA